MNTDLQTMTEQWKSLERKTQKQREKAEDFYESKLMKLIEEAFLENNRDKLYEETEYLIMSVGTSYEPLVLNIRLLQPKKILFLYTQKTECVLEKIVRHCELDATRFSKRRVNETDPLDIYREIKDAYLRWNQPQKIYIDFTGGTKSMSAAAAMAGAVINVQLVYVGTQEYLTDFRKPNPGSEHLYFISNPMEVFGDLEIEKAFALFDQYNYAGAREKLAELKDSVPTPDVRQQLTFVYDLARTYEYWDALDFPHAYESICRLTFALQRDAKINRTFLMMDFYPAIKRQEGILKNLNEMSGMLRQRKNMDILKNKSYIIPLMFTMYTNAEIRRRQEKYDTATLLFYRLLEMVEQRRLAVHNLYVSQMNYKDAVYDLRRQPEMEGLNAQQRLAALKETVVAIRQDLFKRNISTYLPDQISLLDGFILLLAFNDEISESRSGRAIDKLKRIRAMVYLRNNSIFAHGLGSVSMQDFEKFREFVVDIFKEFCRIEHVNFASFAKNMEWLNPIHSVYYTGMEVH